jgi:fructoselysine-6-P-deglycase FrlB-like protein
MGATFYDEELKQLTSSFAFALGANIEPLKAAIAGSAESSVIGVGSGGSFTIASLLCNLHEAYTGRVSRPSTPLEIICNPTLASSSPVFLISAEGKNPDIVEALDRARRHSSRSVHVLTNRADSPLMDHVRELPGVKPYVFELAKKDGYLATNSLLLDAVLVARAYGELNGSRDHLPSDLTGYAWETSPSTSGFRTPSRSLAKPLGGVRSQSSTPRFCDPSPRTSSPSFLRAHYFTPNWLICDPTPTGGICG